MVNFGQFCFCMPVVDNILIHEKWGPIDIKFMVKSNAMKFVSQSWGPFLIYIQLISTANPAQFHSKRANRISKKSVAFSPSFLCQAHYGLSTTIFHAWYFVKTGVFGHFCHHLLYRLIAIRSKYLFSIKPKYSITFTVKFHCWYFQISFYKGLFSISDCFRTILCRQHALKN